MSRFYRLYQNQLVGNKVERGEQMKRNERQLYYSRSDLKKRGWTDAMINRFLSDPDRTGVNPHYSTAAPMKYYLCKRVHKVEESTKYSEWVQKNANRRKAARKVAERKRQEKEKLEQEEDERQELLRAEVAKWVFKVRRQPIEQIKKIAIRHYNRYHEEKSFENEKHFYILAGDDSDPKFIERICVNYIRHNLSNHDKVMRRFKKREGNNSVYLVLKKRICDLIADVYPEFKDECTRQKKKNEDDVNELITLLNWCNEEKSR